MQSEKMITQARDSFAEESKLVQQVGMLRQPSSTLSMIHSSSLYRLSDDELAIVCEYLISDIATVCNISSSSQRLRYLIVEKMESEQNYIFKVMSHPSNRLFVRSILYEKVLFQNSKCLTSYWKQRTLTSQSLPSALEEKSFNDFMLDISLEKKNGYKMLYVKLFERYAEKEIFAKLNQERNHQSCIIPSTHSSYGLSSLIPSTDLLSWRTENTKIPPHIESYNNLCKLMKEVSLFRMHHYVFDRDLRWSFSEQSTIIQDQLIAMLFSLYALQVISVIVFQNLLSDPSLTVIESMVNLFFFSVTIGVLGMLSWLSGHFPLVSLWYWVYRGAGDLAQIERHLNQHLSSYPVSSYHAKSTQSLSSLVEHHVLSQHASALVRHFRFSRCYFFYHYHSLMRGEIKSVLRDWCDSTEKDFYTEYDKMCNKSWWDVLGSLTDSILSTRFFVSVFDFMPVIALLKWFSNSTVRQYLAADTISTFCFCVIHLALVISSIELFDIVRFYIITTNSATGFQKRKSNEEEDNVKKVIELFIKRPLAMFLLIVLKAYVVSQAYKSFL